MALAKLSIDIRNDRSYTALAIAIESNNPSVYEELLRFGADHFVRNDSGMSALNIAVRMALAGITTPLRDIQRELRMAGLLAEHSPRTDGLYEKTWSELLDLQEDEIASLCRQEVLCPWQPIPQTQKPLVLQMMLEKRYYKVLCTLIAKTHKTVWEGSLMKRMGPDIFWRQEEVDRFRAEAGQDATDWSRPQIAAALRAMLLQLTADERERCLDILERDVEPPHIRDVAKGFGRDTSTPSIPSVGTTRGRLHGSFPERRVRKRQIVSSRGHSTRWSRL